MNDEELAVFWEEHEPEEFEGWEKGNLEFKRPPKKLIQLRLDPKDEAQRRRWTFYEAVKLDELTSLTTTHQPAPVPRRNQNVQRKPCTAG
jgi:hypothetical protein